MARQSLANPIPSITAPQLSTKALSWSFGPTYLRERVDGISKRKYVMKKTSSAMEYRLPILNPRSSFIPATRALERLTLSRPAIEYRMPRMGISLRSTLRLWLTVSELVMASLV